ncbi:MAG: TIGR02147 family protein [Desulfobacteraceae bacterium]|nr:TIGR02147 family protein [Desulfobacteraceae bacterium]
MERPKIFDYHDYRRFLKDSFDYAKNNNGKFSFRYFAQRAGFNSGSFLKLVIDGKRNLTNESISKISKGFKLNKQEHDYFENLVFMNQASTHEIRNHYYKQMLSMKGYTKVNHIAKASYDYFSKWYYPAIREIVTFGNRKYTPEKIAGLLKPSISEKQAQEALDHLLMLGLIQKDQDGYWEQCDQHISTGKEVQSFIVAQYHREMLQLASDSIERFSSQERDITALTFSMDAKRMDELKQLIASFRDKIRSSFLENGYVNQVLQLNIQLYPLSKKDGENES